MQQSENVVYLSLDSLIANPYQPRKTFNESTINELALSIKEYGVLNPILVRKKDDKYEIIAGERRWRASKKAGLDKIPAIVKNIDDSKLAEIALIENLQRENLSPIEEAASYKEILSLTNLTEQKLSEIIGKSQPTISNKMRLLNLTDEVKEALNNRKISERHARSLLMVKDKNKQIELLNKIITERLTVKELDSTINKINISNNDIKDTIDDILASINKKELEKESDNMNNGNFFPNYNNVDQNNANASLNAMNMQAMPNAGTIPAQPTPVTTPNAVEQPMMFNPNVEQPVSEVVNQPQEIPVITNQESPIPNFGVAEQPTIEQPISGPVQEITPPPVEQPVQEPVTPVVDNNATPNNFNDIPLFSTQTITPEPPAGIETIPETNNIAVETPVENNPIPPVTPVLPTEDTPLFNSNAVEPAPAAPAAPTPAPTPAFEVPVETPLPTMPEDKYTQVKNLLDSNGIAYKAYSGETGNCIIIEL